MDSGNLMWVDTNPATTLNREYPLGNSFYTYFLEKKNDIYLTVSPTDKGKATFIVKPTRNFDEYLNKPLHVTGKYILEDSTVVVVIDEVSLK